MSKIHYLSLVALSLFGCEQQNTTAEYGPKARSSNEIRTVETYSTGYMKDRNCMAGKGDCAIGAEEPQFQNGELSNRTPRVSVSIQDGQLQMVYLSPYDPSVEVVTINPAGEFYVMSHVAKDLGYNLIKVKQGQYKVDRTQGRYGSVRFDIDVQ